MPIAQSILAAMLLQRASVQDVNRRPVDKTRLSHWASLWSSSLRSVKSLSAMRLETAPVVAVGFGPGATFAGFLAA